MPPKERIKKKKVKKTGPVVSLKESLLAYQIDVKEKAREQTFYEITQLEAHVAESKRQVQTLHEEHDRLIARLAKQSIEVEKTIENELVSGDELINRETQLKNEAVNKSEEAISALHHKIQDIEDELGDVLKRKARAEWLKGLGLAKNETYMNDVSQRMQEIADEYRSSKDQMIKMLEMVEHETKLSAEKQINAEKSLAAEQAVKKLNRNKKKELVDHEWLVNEVQVLKRESSKLESENEKLEEEVMALGRVLYGRETRDLQHVPRKVVYRFDKDFQDLSEKRSVLPSSEFIDKIKNLNYYAGQKENEIIRQELRLKFKDPPDWKHMLGTSGDKLIKEQRYFRDDEFARYVVDINKQMSNAAVASEVLNLLNFVDVECSEQLVVYLKGFLRTETRRRFWPVTSRMIRELVIDRNKW